MLFLKLAFWEGFVFKVNKIFGIYLRLLGCMGIPVASGPYFLITHMWLCYYLTKSPLLYRKNLLNWVCASN